MKKLEFTVNQSHILRGKPNCVSECPAALSLKDIGYDAVGVNPNYVQLKKGNTWYLFRTSKDLADFIYRYDHHELVHPSTFRCVPCLSQKKGWEIKNEKT